MDIVDTLRQMMFDKSDYVCALAADEIERLRADLYELQTERDIVRTNNDVLSAERDALKADVENLTEENRRLRGEG